MWVWFGSILFSVATAMACPASRCDAADRLNVVAMLVRYKRLSRPLLSMDFEADRAYDVVPSASES